MVRVTFNGSSVKAKTAGEALPPSKEAFWVSSGELYARYPRPGRASATLSRCSSCPGGLDEGAKRSAALMQAPARQHYSGGRVTGNAV